MKCMIASIVNLATNTAATTEVTGRGGEVVVVATREGSVASTDGSITGERGRGERETNTSTRKDSKKETMSITGGRERLITRDDDLSSSQSSSTISHETLILIRSHVFCFVF